MTTKNAISWFEIPAPDLARAQKFYETILGIQMIPLDTPHIKMRMFPIEDPMTGIGGALALADFYKPSAEAGGKIVVPKTQISPEHGYMAIFMDTEGNRVGLHSVPPPKG
jgi:predicted enzyme related to lactoylglutathione lyase